MRYIDLIADKPLIWGLFGLYLVGTSWLAWLGHKKTDDIESFAVGRGDMPAWVVGITLAASIASAATFVVNPGLIYVFGMSALMHLGVAAALGVMIGLFTLSFGFRRVGQRVKAITVPQWVGQRYGSKGLSIFFAGINLLSITFMVLIVGGLSIVMTFTLGLTQHESVILIIGFVFSYIFLGGTYAHAYTNTLQGIIMTVIATIIVVSGFPMLADGWGAFSAAVSAEGANLMLPIDPTSPLYGSVFTVWVCGFIIGFALVCQPHILTKALYVKSDREVTKYLIVTALVSTVFTALLLVGLYARASDIPAELFLGADGLPKADNVVSVYISHMFGPGLQAVIAVALLAAGMSTLDGILVALSTITANDLFLNLTENNVLANKTPRERGQIAHRASQVILVLLGLATYLILLEPPETLSLFGQYGVFALVSVSAVPIAFGVFVPRMNKTGAIVASVCSLVVYAVLFWWSQSGLERGVNLVQQVQEWGIGWLFDTSAVQLGLINPAVLATYSILAGLLGALVVIVLRPRGATTAVVALLAAAPLAGGMVGCQRAQEQAQEEPQEGAQGANQGKSAKSGGLAAPSLPMLPGERSATEPDAPREAASAAPKVVERAPVPSPVPAPVPSPKEATEPTERETAAPPRVETAGAVGALEVIEATAARAVESRQPVGASSRFPLDTGEVFAWFKVKNDGEAANTEIVWKKEGQEVFRIGLQVGTSPSWRTWARKTMGENDRGAWTATLVGPSGDSLAEVAFVVE